MSLFCPSDDWVKIYIFGRNYFSLRHINGLRVVNKYSVTNSLLKFVYIKPIYFRGKWNQLINFSLLLVYVHSLMLYLQNCSNINISMSMKNY